MAKGSKCPWQPGLNPAGSRTAQVLDPSWIYVFPSTNRHRTCKQRALQCCLTFLCKSSLLT